MSQAHLPLSWICRPVQSFLWRFGLIGLNRTSARSPSSRSALSNPDNMPSLNNRRNISKLKINLRRQISNGMLFLAFDPRLQSLLFSAFETQPLFVWRLKTRYSIHLVAARVCRVRHLAHRECWTRYCCFTRRPCSRDKNSRWMRWLRCCRSRAAIPLSALPPLSFPLQYTPQ